MNVKLTSEFKKKTSQAVFSIILFISVYLLILLLACALTILCFFAGGFIIIAKPMFFTMIIGVGIASLGVLVLVFLLKFLFSSTQIDRTHLYEIKRQDEPQLFDLLDEIVTQVATRFPKKVYLSSDVNAAVFYDSSFWSMFFPVRKNLRIGMGLVNSLTKSELKAILSHELGHFSQRSMAVGSYVYNVNYIIYNMLFDNESYKRLIAKWAGTNRFFEIFITVAVKINGGIQWILRKMYNVVNKNYMGLSREMEFHADQIASQITGYKPLKDSLLRLSLADSTFNSVLSFYDQRIAANQKTENIFRDHLFVLNFVAQMNQIRLVNGFPDLTDQDKTSFYKSKLVLTDQWSSHPSIEDRVERLEKSGFLSDAIDNTPASAYFTDSLSIQKILTDSLFEQVKYEGTVSNIPFDDFRTQFENEYQENSFSVKYNGYYNLKNIVPFDIIEAENSNPDCEFDDLFSDKQVNMAYQNAALKNDIITLKQIASGEINYKSFDYDGIRYNKKDCEQLLVKLEKELAATDAELKKNDMRIFSYFRKEERIAGSENILKEMYQVFWEYDLRYEKRYEFYYQLSNELQFVNVNTPFENIRLNFSRIEPIEEKWKSEIKTILENPHLLQHFTQTEKDNLNLYLSSKWSYFGGVSYIDENLSILFNALSDYIGFLSRTFFLLKKDLLDYQIQIIDRLKAGEAD
ncbi:MAG: M48 family metalloprotease [Dysgonamonadaceae bacterium]